jgi:hypothetical protein
MHAAKWGKTAVERADRIGCGPRQGPMPLAWRHVHLPAHPRSVPAQYQALTVTDLPNMPSLSYKLLSDAAPFSQLYWTGKAIKPQRNSMSRQITPQRRDLCITYVRATTTATHDTLAGQELQITHKAHSRCTLRSRHASKPIRHSHAAQK